MIPKSPWPFLATLILLLPCQAGCQPVQTESLGSPEPTLSPVIHTQPARPGPAAGNRGQDTSTPPGPASSPVPTDTSGNANATVGHPAPTPDLSTYAFPASMDPAKHYLFYLHGAIVEDQGLPAISPEYGEYEYGSILEKLAQYGFVVISERRPANTDGAAYAQRIADQVSMLLQAGVPAQNITVVGASKGAGITIFVSHYLGNDDINYVLLAICAPDNVLELIRNRITPSGNVLSIYDSTDELAGSCQDLFAFSEGKGLGRYDEIILNIGTGHGILYQPLDEWIVPTVRWAGKPWD